MPALSVAVQVVVLENGAEMVAAETLRERLPSLVNVTLCVTELEPTVVSAIAREPADSVANAPIPVPLRLVVLVPSEVMMESTPLAFPCVVGVKTTL